MAISGLVPARFLTLTAHFVLTVTILWSRDENVKACLPLSYDRDMYEEKDTQFIVALSLTLLFCLLEYVGFFGGFTTFLPTPGLISTCLHSAACVALAFFIWDVWDCDLYWSIFVFTSVIPGIIEAIVILGVCVMKNI